MKTEKIFPMPEIVFHFFLQFIMLTIVLAGSFLMTLQYKLFFLNVTEFTLRCKANG